DAAEVQPDFEEGTTGKPFYVVGPIVKPKGGPLEYIEKLIDITQSAFNLGWISKNDVYEGLNDKLVAAKENIKKGRSNYHTAINIVEAYKHLLDAQRGKAIEEQCYRMLYYDANELIGMLR
ncbi:MAG: FIMAH domain-containing protein, partial [Brevinematia bacterium]